MSIQISHLSKHYGTQKAVDDISFQVSPGEIVGFLGPNGAGKSTTMKIATGYLSPGSGQVQVAGHNVATESLAVRQQVGYLPEHNPLYPDLYVTESLRFSGRLHGLSGPGLARRVAEVVEQVGLGPEQHKKIGQLSKGYRQRVGLAQAFLHNPPVLILDEPTTGLDPNQLTEIRAVIRAVGKDKTVLFSTHIMQEVEALCNRVVIINKGQLVANSTLADLRTGLNQHAVFLAEFETDLPNPDLLGTLPGLLGVAHAGRGQYRLTVAQQHDMRAALFRLAADYNLTLIGLRQQETSLEQVFQELTR